ncbi:hypothetical protein DFS34DRAFT_661659 [Phlyctochytrium arcticum]|nr:hypothetical protein DFS34DRAFT_661659 [Phlyctochytrium arcticum]
MHVATEQSHHTSHHHRQPQNSPVSAASLAAAAASHEQQQENGFYPSYHFDGDYGQGGSPRQQYSHYSQPPLHAHNQQETAASQSFGKGKRNYKDHIPDESTSNKNRVEPISGAIYPLGDSIPSNIDYPDDQPQRLLSKSHSGKFWASQFDPDSGVKASEYRGQVPGSIYPGSAKDSYPALSYGQTHITLGEKSRYPAASSGTVPLPPLKEVGLVGHVSVSSGYPQHQSQQRTTLADTHRGLRRLTSPPVAVAQAERTANHPDWSQQQQFASHGYTPAIATAAETSFPSPNLQIYTNNLSLAQQGHPPEVPYPYQQQNPFYQQSPHQSQQQQRELLRKQHGNTSFDQGLYGSPLSAPLHSSAGAANPWNTPDPKFVGPSHHSARLNSAELNYSGQPTTHRHPRFSAPVVPAAKGVDYFKEPASFGSIAHTNAYMPSGSPAGHFDTNPFSNKQPQSTLDPNARGSRPGSSDMLASGSHPGNLDRPATGKSLGHPGSRVSVNHPTTGFIGFNSIAAAASPHGSTLSSSSYEPRIGSGGQQRRNRPSERYSEQNSGIGSDIINVHGGGHPYPGQYQAQPSSTPYYQHQQQGHSGSFKQDSQQQQQQLGPVSATLDSHPASPASVRRAANRSLLPIPKSPSSPSSLKLNALAGGGGGDNGLTPHTQTFGHVSPAHPNSRKSYHPELNSPFTKAEQAARRSVQNEDKQPRQNEYAAKVVKPPTAHTDPTMTTRRDPQQVNGQAVARSTGNERSSRPVSARVPPAGTPLRELKLPLSPEATIIYYNDLLTSYEQREIYDFAEIYFAGAASVHKIGGSRRKSGADMAETANVAGTAKDDDNSLHNAGYDDSRGDYYLTKHDHVGYRYEILSLLGKGSFGQVVKCLDHKTKNHVALKIIRNKKRFEKQGLVEVKVLERLKVEDADNSHGIVHMVESFLFRGHLCITFELLGMNLYEWLKAGSFRGVHLGVIKRFTTQMLRCLDLLAKAKIVHCDLKPENILLRDPSINQPTRADSNQSGHSPNGSDFRVTTLPVNFNPKSPVYNIKVIDFGSSCFENEKIYTYVQSRFYRSPEVILGLSYNMSIDVWSLGCILAELYTGYPLFPGENEQEQLACIMEVKGVPNMEFVERGTRRKAFFDSTGAPRIVANSKGKKRRPSTRTLAQVLRCSDTAFVDFVDKCLEWDPLKRMSPEQAMSHEWLLGKSANRSENRQVSSSNLGASTGSNSSLQSKRRPSASADPTGNSYSRYRSDILGNGTTTGKAAAAIASLSSSSGNGGQYTLSSSRQNPRKSGAGGQNNNLSRQPVYTASGSGTTAGGSALQSIKSHDAYCGGGGGGQQSRNTQQQQSNHSGAPLPPISIAYNTAGGAAANTSKSHGRTSTGGPGGQHRHTYQPASSTNSSQGGPEGPNQQQQQRRVKLVNQESRASGLPSYQASSTSVPSHQQQQRRGGGHQSSTGPNSFPHSQKWKG